METKTAQHTDGALKNAEAEQCAQNIALVITDKIKRQALFAAFLETHPNLKNWEGLAIGNRAVQIAKALAMANP